MGTCVWHIARHVFVAPTSLTPVVGLKHDGQSHISALAEDFFADVVAFLAVH